MEPELINTTVKKPEPINILRKRLNIIRSRLYLLEKQDRMIMSMYIDNGLSLRQLALLFDTSPSSISRRIKKIAFELTKGDFISCLKKKDVFTHSEMTIAKDYFVTGLSIKQIAERENTSFYQIRELITEIRQTLNRIQKEKQ